MENGLNGVQYLDSLENLSTAEYLREKKEAADLRYLFSFDNVYMKLSFKNKGQYEVFLDSHDTYFLEH